MKLNLNDIAEFTWLYGSQWFLETNKGNFVWSDPEYGGNNTIVPYADTYEKFIDSGNIPFGRAKGEHVVGDYCGFEVKIQ